MSDGLAGYAIKCIESKADTNTKGSSSFNDPLQELILAIISTDNTEVCLLHSSVDIHHNIQLSVCKQVLLRQSEILIGMCRYQW